MKATCISLGDKQGESYWVTVDREYDVLSILFSPNGWAKLRIMADNGETPFLADVRLFAMSPQPIPGSWMTKILQDGVTEIGPASWMEKGFWERYFDGDPSAVRLFEDELERMGVNFRRD